MNIRKLVKGVISVKKCDYCHRAVAATVEFGEDSSTPRYHDKKQACAACFLDLSVIAQEELLRYES